MVGFFFKKRLMYAGIIWLSCDMHVIKIGNRHCNTTKNTDDLELIKNLS